MANTVGGSVVWNLDVDDKALASGLSNARDQVDKAAADINKKFSGLTSSLSGAFDRTSQSLSNTSNGLIGLGAAPLGAMALATKTALTFDDTLTDVAKTTGISGKNLEKLGNDLLGLSKNTRTTVSELLTIAEIGGQLGIAEKDIGNFTKAIDVFNVALGKDFSGGVEEATTSVGKLVNLFDETKNLDIADAINKAGSAINYLGATGAGTTANMTEFATRLGQLPKTLRPTIQDALALGTLFEETGLSAQIASGGLTNFFLVAGKEIAGFAKVMGVTEQAAKDLLQQDPTEFAVKFAQSVKGLDSVQLATTLNDLKIGTQESIKVIGSLGSGVDRFRTLQAGANQEFIKATSLTDEYNVKNNNAAANVDKFKNNLSAVAVTLGTSFLPALNDILTSLTPIINQFATFATNNPQLVTTILSLGAGIGALGIALKGISIVLSGFSSIISIVGQVGPAINLMKTAIFGLQPAFAFILANPIVLVIGGIIAALALLVVAWNQNWGDIQGITARVFSFIGSVTNSIVNLVSSTLVTLGSVFVGTWNNIAAITSSIWTNIVNIVGSAINGMRNIIGSISGFIQSVWGSMVNFFSNIGSSIVSAITKPFIDAYNYIGRIAQNIKEAANQINPFYRNSPSLVDNVRNGLGIIRKEFDTLQDINFPPMAASAAMEFNDPLNRTLGSGTVSEAQPTSAPNQNVTVNIGKVSNMEDVNMINREIGFKLAVV